MILQHRLKAQPDRPEIEVIRRIAPLPLVTCCAGLLNQVLMNILVNAIDALENYYYEQSHQPTRALDSQSNLASAWAPKITITAELSDRQAVVITIADNGSGIHPAIKNKVFDPFFTTKSVGKGTGLGLSTSHTIVTEQHQGCLDCFSELGQGAEFVITLPLTSKTASSTVRNPWRSLNHANSS